MSQSLVVALLALLGLSAVLAWCVAAEVSLLASRKTRIAELVERGNARAKIVQKVMRDPDRFFAAAQFGITLATVTVGVLCEPAISDAIAHALGQMQLPLPTETVHIIGVVIGLVLASYFQIIFAELVPRSLAIRRAETIAMQTVPVMNLLATLLAPFIWLLKGGSQLALRVFGFKDNSHGEERVHSREEIRMLLEASEEGGAIDQGEAELIDNAIEFSDISAREVMVPRTEMICFDAGDPLEKIMRTVSAHSYDRYPVYKEDIDHVSGLLHVKDLMRAAWSRAAHITAGQLMRQQLLTVPDSHRADEVLAKMRSTHSYIAIVLDEYGGTAGLVTLDDLLSALAGGIGKSKHDSRADIHTRADGVVLVNGLTTLGDFGDEFDLELKDENYDTIGGFVMGQLGRIPIVGDEVSVGSGDLRLRVESMDGKRVEQLRVLGLG